MRMLGGYLMFELLLVTALASALFLVLGGAVVEMYCSVHRREKFTTKFLQLTNALAILERDLVRAKQSSMMQQRDGILFSAYFLDHQHMLSDESIRWRIKKGALQRIAGQHDFINKRWRSKSVTVLAGKVERLSMEFDELRQAVVIQYDEAGLQLERRIPLHATQIVASHEVAA